jgi:para-aminobenzoate synthetase component 1
MYCRFENRLTRQALVLENPVDRVAAHHADELPAVFEAIRRAQQKGLWTSLLLDYELGAALLGLARPAAPRAAPLLTAQFYSSVQHTQPWESAEHEPTLRCSLAQKKADYMRAIERIRTDIHNGEYYQANYTVPIHVHSDQAPEQVYRALAQRHPTAYSAFIQDEDRQIASFSPELFVERTGDLLRVRPMKGTRPRFTDPIKDQASAHALRHSEKDCAENVMIVDLLRNDLGRLARPGSVKVESLLSVEQYPSVWTMTSTIQALCDEHDIEQLLLALFPCGSITGAPKLAAMTALQALEQRQRGIYCGSIGWLAPHGDFRFNVAIRTLEFHTNHEAIFGVGGGIVHDSDPELEWQELLWKARILGSPILTQ